MPDPPRNPEWLLEHGTREQLIAWLVSNDPNGIYTDADSALEDMPPITKESALEIMRHQLEDQ